MMKRGPLCMQILPKNLMTPGTSATMMMVTISCCKLSLFLTQQNNNTLENELFQTETLQLPGWLLLMLYEVISPTNHC